MAKKSKSQTKEPQVVKKAQKKKREVLVVSCPPDFPISSRPKRETPATTSTGQEPSNKRALNWYDTAHEIRSLGATAFVGKQKKSFQDEQYEKLTGRKRKMHQIPLPIVRGIKKKAEQRLARQIQEAKDSGTVLPKSLTKKEKKSQDPTARIHGPAPSIGFMKKGFLKVKRPT